MEKVRYMISDAANIVNVESHVLRYWEDELELNVPRNELGHRYYTKENIQEFQRIKELKEQGYQLKAIRMIVHNMSPDAQAEVGAVHQGENRICTRLHIRRMKKLSRRSISLVRLRAFRMDMLQNRISMQI